MEYDPNNETKDSDDSDDSLPSLSNRLIWVGFDGWRKR